MTFMEEHPHGFASLSEAADAVASYLPHRKRPHDTSGLRHNLRQHEGRWTWHWDPQIPVQARTIINAPEPLTKRLTSAATRLRQPCLLVRGADSDVLTPGVANEFVQLAQTASLAEVPGAGHMVAGDNNDAFTAAISTWLQEVLKAEPRIATAR